MKRSTKNVEVQSSTKKDKVDNEKSKIPQLNEDVIGIILRHVIQKHQNYVSKKFEVIAQHFNDIAGIPIQNRPSFIHAYQSTYDVYFSKEYYGEFSWTKQNPNLDIRHFAWPDALETNTKRLVHHAELKMFPNVKLEIGFNMPLERYILSNRELDLMLETFKHFACIAPMATLDGFVKPADYIEYLRSSLDHRGSLLAEKLEEIKI